MGTSPIGSIPLTGEPDLPETPVDLQLTAINLCATGAPKIQWLLFLDLDQDGVQETVVNSLANNQPNTVHFGNAFNPNYSGGEARAFDERPVAEIYKYRFYHYAQQTGGDQTVSRVVWRSSVTPNDPVVPELPPGNHRIEYTIRDACDNEAVCAYDFTVVADSTVSSPEPGFVSGFRLYQNRPNPFSDATAISFDLPGVGEAELTVADAAGRVVWTRMATFPAGHNAVLLRAEDLPAGAGVWFYTLRAAGFAATRKMIRMTR